MAEIFRAVSGLDIEVGGRTLHAHPLPWKVAIEILGIIEADKKAGKAYHKTLQAIMEKLPAAVGLKAGDLDALDYADLDELITRFFHLRKNGKSDPTPSATSFVAEITAPQTSTT